MKRSFIPWGLRASRARISRISLVLRQSKENLLQNVLSNQKKQKSAKWFKTNDYNFSFETTVTSNYVKNYFSNNNSSSISSNSSSSSSSSNSSSSSSSSNSTSSTSSNNLNGDQFHQCKACYN